MPEILYAPHREQVVTTNAWAFMHWLDVVHDVPLENWTALQRFSVERSVEFRAAIARFARLPGSSIRLSRHSGPREALAFRKADASRFSLSRDELIGSSFDQASVPGEIATPLLRLWPISTLIRPAASVLLHADLRPDDRLLVVGSNWPWLTALLEGSTVILATLAASTLLAVAAEEQASVLVAPVQTLSEAAFQRSSRRPNLANLRAIVATGGPLSPEGRRRIYTWVKSDLMLLARTGDTVWGNPLEPVLVRPPATPALFTRRASGPAIP